MPEFGGEYHVTVEANTAEEADRKIRERLHGHAHARRCSAEPLTSVRSWVLWERSSDGALSPTYGAVSPLTEMALDRFDDGGGI